MGFGGLIEKLQALPADKQAEVFDFVDFLAARSAGADCTDREFSDFSLGQALRGMEDDPVTYSIDDLSEKWT